MFSFWIEFCLGSVGSMTAADLFSFSNLLSSRIKWVSTPPLSAPGLEINLTSLFLKKKFLDRDYMMENE